MKNNSEEKDNRSRANELISKSTIFTWRKNTVQEIEYLVKDKEGFYKLYLRNLN